MVNIEQVKPEIISRLSWLNPDKIILFGSYAFGNPTEDSDVDLFLLKDDLELDQIRDFERVLEFYSSNTKIGFDILSAPTGELEKKDDYFYKVDILQNGVVLYE